LNEFFIGNDSYVAQYQGHGQTKIAYKLTSYLGGAFHGCVLKVICPSKDDEEVATMEHLNDSDSRICVTIHQKGHLDVTDHPILTAWICAYAIPLDVFLPAERAVKERCMLGVMICILRAAESGCLISDVGFYNFGVLDGSVVIIDAGSRGVSEERIIKSKLTQAFWSKFIVKARQQCVGGKDQMYLHTYSRIYLKACNIRTALLELERFWNLCPTCDRMRTDVKGESAIGLVPEEMSVRVDDTAASSSSAFPAHWRAPKPQDVSEVKGPTASSSSRFPQAPWRAPKLHIVSEVNEPTASPSPLRAPMPQPPMSVKTEWVEDGQGPLAIAWDCKFYSQNEFFKYYRHNLEYQQCAELTDEIITCMGFMLADSPSLLTSHELRLLHCLKSMCCRQTGTSTVGLGAEDELAIFLQHVYTCRCGIEKHFFAKRVCLLTSSCAVMREKKSWTDGRMMKCLNGKLMK
jgi:hypothetical protein